MFFKNRGIKYLVLISVMILASSMLLSFLPVNGEEKIYSGIIRLHVIADSDSEEDQKLKLCVRDAVLDAMSAFPRASDKDSACSIISSHIGAIKNAAERVLTERGCRDSVDVTLGKEQYPVRYYEGFTLPAGEYTSLKVTIGEGAGHNWWCVLFPPLCTSACEEEARKDFIDAGFTSEEYKLIKNDSASKYKVRFKILEILSEVFGFDY